MKAVADASSLIHPAKVPAIWRKMQETFEQVLIPEAVYKEILKGKDIGSSDVPVVERAIADGWIKIRRVEVKPRSLPDNLGSGEKEAITLMQMEKEEVDWLLIDDEVASRTARLMDLNVRPAVYLLIYWTRKKLMEASEALVLLDDLVKTGYRLSSEDYISVKELIR